MGRKARGRAGVYKYDKGSICKESKVPAWLSAARKRNAMLKRKSEGTGYVYLLKSECKGHPAIYKIGYTQQDPRDRATQVSSHKGRKFVVVTHSSVKAPLIVEENLLLQVGEYICEGREYFCGLDISAEVFHAMVSKAAV